MRRRWAAAVTLAAVLAATDGAAAAARDPFCLALDEVADKARASGRPVFVYFRRIDEPASLCWLKPTDDALQHGYCQVAIDRAGIEFSHRYPWMVKACLARNKGITTEEAPWAYTGYVRRGRTDHLTGVLPNGVRVDVRYVPDTDRDNPDDPKSRLNGYYGRYVMTLWAP